MTPPPKGKWDHLKLPDHVEVDPQKRKSGTVLYFRYVFPDGSRESLGSDVDEAKATAEALNKALYTDETKLQRMLAKAQSRRRVISMNPLVPEVVAEFIPQWLDKQGYSDRSYKERNWKLEQYKRHWPTNHVRELTTFELAQFLKPLSAESRRQHRYLMNDFFKFAKSQGYYPDSNPVADIEKVKPQARKRMRHTWVGFTSVRAAAVFWMANAMDSALYTLQRRSDLVALTSTQHINLKKNTITILQQKAKEYNKPVYLEIEMGEELREVVERSYSDGVNAPHLVHYKPKRITKQMREAKEHPYAVKPDYLTRAYADARRESGIYDHLEPEQRPSFHGIRALGVFLYWKAGYPIEYIQALAGHATVKMTQHYREGHEKLKPVRVKAELSMGDLDLTDVDWETELQKLPEELQEIIHEDDD